MAQKKVMIIDDDPEYLGEIGNVLAGAGYKVELLSDSTQVMPWLKSWRPDVVLLDLNMQGKDGLQVAREINEDRATRGTIVIAVTGFYTEKEYAKLMQEYGLRQCLLKPVKPLDVIHCIENAVKEE
ncbi:response regulator [candidate division FCPU426 bacterium]|nr:response regulator [candidate division FCPU426 bacterium]